MTYTPKERDYIKLELKHLESARNDKYPDNTLLEWISSFQNEGFTAEHACKMIRKIKISGQTYKVKFSDFIDCFEDAMQLPLIIPIKQLPEVTRETNPPSHLLPKVRDELGISYIDFLLESKDNGYEPEKWYEHLKANPDETKCVKLEDKQREQRKNKIITLAEAIKNI